MLGRGIKMLINSSSLEVSFKVLKQWSVASLMALRECPSEW